MPPSRIRPDNAEAHYDLGTVLTNIPSWMPKAIAEFQAALRSEPGFQGSRKVKESSGMRVKLKQATEPFSTSNSGA